MPFVKNAAKEQPAGAVAPPAVPESNPQPILDGHKLNALSQQLAMGYTGGQIRRVVVEVIDAKGFVTRHSLG